MTALDLKQATSDIDLFPYFEDIVEYQHNLSRTDLRGDESDDDGGDDDEDDPYDSRWQDAQNLTLDDIFSQLHKRGLKARGFHSDDVKTLQDAFDAEYAEYKEIKRKERQADRERRQKEKTARNRQRRMEIELSNEQEQLSNNEHLAALLVLMKKGCAPVNCRIELNSVSARMFAFAQCASSCNMLHLDVSNQGLPDYVGAYLCRALGKNSTIKKLELGNNRFGVQTCKELGTALTANSAVEYVCLECNPLIEDDGRFIACSSNNIDGENIGGDDLSGIQALADMLSINRTLRNLSLWHCMIGPDGGKLIGDAMDSSNDTITMLKGGYNAWEDSTIRRIDAKIIANREVRRVEQEAEARQREEEERRRLEEKRIEEEKARQEANESWLKEQRRERDERRRKEMEEDLERARLEKERLNEEERKRAEEEAAAAAKTKKKTKKSKKQGGKTKRRK